MVLGTDLARSIGAMPGDKVTLIAPQGRVTPAGLIPRLKQFTVVGLFEIGMFEYDSGLALIHLEDAQTLYQMDKAVSGLAPEARRPLCRAHGGARAADDARQRLLRLGLDAQPREFLPRVEIEKRVMFIILTLIVAVPRSTSSRRW
jgi:lipoprotein-releasing system permease protein